MILGGRAQSLAGAPWVLLEGEVSAPGHRPGVVVQGLDHMCFGTLLDPLSLFQDHVQRNHPLHVGASSTHIAS